MNLFLRLLWLALISGLRAPVTLDEAETRLAGAHSHRPAALAPACGGLNRRVTLSGIATCFSG